MKFCTVNGQLEIKKLLSDREKFIHHFVTLTTVKIIHNKINYDRDFEGQNEEEVQRIVRIIRETRCRHLRDDEVEILLDELRDEALCGGTTINQFIK